MTQCIDSEKWIDVVEVAKTFGVSKPTVYAWIKAEKIPKPITHGKTRWNRQLFKLWLQTEYKGMIYVTG